MLPHPVRHPCVCDSGRWHALGLQRGGRDPVLKAAPVTSASLPLFQVGTTRQERASFHLVHFLRFFQRCGGEAGLGAKDKQSLCPPFNTLLSPSAWTPPPTRHPLREGGGPCTGTGCPGRWEGWACRPGPLAESARNRQPLACKDTQGTHKGHAKNQWILFTEDYKFPKHKVDNKDRTGPTGRKREH